jgi:cysteine synthase B
VRVAEGLVSDGAPRATIVFVVSDGGWKYLSTGAWTGDLDEVAADIEGLIVF